MSHFECKKCKHHVPNSEWTVEELCAACLQNKSADYQGATYMGICSECGEEANPWYVLKSHGVHNPLCFNCKEKLIIEYTTKSNLPTELPVQTEAFEVNESERINKLENEVKELRECLKGSVQGMLEQNAIVSRLNTSIMLMQTSMKEIVTRLDTQRGTMSGLMDILEIYKKRVDALDCKKEEVFNESRCLD